MPGGGLTPEAQKALSESREFKTLTPEEIERGKAELERREKESRREEQERIEREKKESKKGSRGRRRKKKKSSKQKNYQIKKRSCVISPINIETEHSGILTY
jgi:hypothetical protein